MKGDFNIMAETQKYLYADSERQTERVNWLELLVLTKNQGLLLKVCSLVKCWYSPG